MVFAGEPKSPVYVTGKSPGPVGKAKNMEKQKFDKLMAELDAAIKRLEKAVEEEPVVISFSKPDRS